MRVVSRMFAVTLAIFALFAVIVPAVGNAQSPEGTDGPIPLPDHELIVTKIVEGPVPPGTEFEVEVNCTELLKGTEGSAEGGQAFPVTLTFDEQGGSQSVDVPFFTDECTATETEDGGASSVVYGAGTGDDSCDVTPTATDVTANYLDIELAAEPSGVPEQTISCEVTVTNTFEPEPEPEPEPQPAAVAVVQVTPSFTG